MKSVNDVELVKSIQGGRMDDFSKLVRKYETPLVRLISRHVRDMELARDVVQETFLKVHQNIHNFEGRCSFKNWIYKIAINTARNKIRSFRDMENIDDTVIVENSMVESRMIHQELIDQLHEFMETLPNKQRQTVELRVLKDLSFKDVAEIMSCPYDTAKANYRHAMLKLKDMILSQAEQDRRHSA